MFDTIFNILSYSSIVIIDSWQEEDEINLGFIRFWCTKNEKYYKVFFRNDVPEIFEEKE